MASRLPMATRVRRTPGTLERILPRGIRLSDLAADRRGAPMLVLGLLVVASLVAVVPLSAQGTGGTVPDDARGEASLADRSYLVADARGQSPRDLVAVAGPADEPADDAAAAAPADDGPFSTDGTLIKPYTVDTTAPEGIEDRVRLYKVRPGDSLSGIANRFGVELMTIWWANKLQRTDALRVGQELVIPPADGVLHTVVEGDTLASVASKYKVQARQITRFNQIEGNVLVLGQVLLVPGGEGKPIPVPKPVYVASPGGSGSGSGSSSGNSSGGSCSSCSFSGSMRWPVSGGHISQYFHYGHYGLDIAAPYGTPVMAGAGGSVIFAGWRDNGGGYQVWISHGNGVYTTYNHMSSVSVGGGASVGAGQQVGRIGATGWATGPHLHFEVWMGQIWNGGYRVNPLNYL
jgi:murein DD-endopeptidase MepM/ murein hydrolase activator NlpD